MKDESRISEATIEPTDRSKNDMKLCTKVNRLILTPIGIWPIDRQATVIKEILCEIRVFICYFFILFLLVPCALHTFISEKDSRKQISMIGPLIFYLTAITKYCFLVARRSDICKCLDHILEDWRRVSIPADRKIMLANAKFGQFIATICTIFMYSSATLYHIILPFSAVKHVSSKNITVRPLTVPVYKPLFAADESPSYEIVFTTQIISAIVVYTITIGAVRLTAVFVLHACGQLNIVMSRLNNSIEESERINDTFKNRMAEIVELHLRVLSFITRIEDMLNEVYLVEFLGCMINICLIGYYLMTQFQQAETIGGITYCVLLVSFTFNIFIFCYMGEMLTQEGKKVGTTAYMIEWYKLPGKDARSLILLLAMTNYPCSITAGKMAELSYKSFSTMLKTSMGYFNLLRTVTS